MDFSHYLNSLLNPKNIVVIGASEREGSYGTLIWNNLQAASPKAKLYAVNPKYKKIGSARCYSSVTQIRSDADLVIIVSPPETYLKAIPQAVEKNCRFIMLCGGFSKSELTDEITRLIDETAASGIKIIGPQSLGFICPRAGINASFFPQMPTAGSVGLVSQSPGLSCCMMNITDGFSFVIDPGLERTLSAADYIDMLAHDNATKCIALYLESFSEPRKLLSAIRAASQKKPVILLKGGQTAGSADIVINNSGAREDEDGVMEEALRRSGVLLVNSLRELNYAIQVFTAGRELTQDTLFGLVNSKGLDSLLADHAYRNGLKSASIDSDTAQKLRDDFHVSFPFANPINVGLGASASETAEIIRLLLSLPQCGGMIAGIVITPAFNPEEFTDLIISTVEKSRKPFIMTWIGAEINMPAIQKLRAAGIPAVSDMRGACIALRLLSEYRQSKQDSLFGTFSVKPIKSEDFEGARKIVRTAVSQNHRLLYEEEAKKLLASIGIETTAGISAGSLGEAIEASKALGFPLAVKLRMDGLVSKSEAGGAILGVRSERELKNAWKSLKERVASMFSAEERFGVFLQKTLDTNNKRELKVGLKITRHFGPIVYLQVGGLYGPICGASVFSFVPLSLNDAKRMIAQEPFKTLLGAYKGLGSCDTEAIIRILIRLSELAVEIPALRSIEIDPLLCGQSDAIVLDALCVIGSDELRSDEKASHLILPYRRPTEKKETGRFGLLKFCSASLANKEAFLSYLTSLSDNSRRLRFHSANTSLEIAAASSLSYDPDRTFSILALENKQDRDEVVAEARFSLLPNGEDAEFGISVREDKQGQGIASALMSELEAEARARGVRSLIGYVLKGNDSMAYMMGKRGYRRETDENDPHVDLFVLDTSADSN